MVKEQFLNTYINNVRMNDVVEKIDNFIINKSHSYVVAVNVDVIVKIEKDDYLKEIIDNADIVITDGKPLIWISRLFHNTIIDKISGSDLVPQICEMARNKGYSIYILGGAEGVPERAKKNLELNYPGINIVGTYSPPNGFDKNDNEVNKINIMIRSKKPDILLVCFGCPKQEKFVYENKSEYDATISICAGATVDFIAGNIRRAPRIVSDIGLEWFYRFLKEPKRLFRRYFVEDLFILKIIIKYKKKRKG